MPPELAARIRESRRRGPLRPARPDRPRQARGGQRRRRAVAARGARVLPRARDPAGRALGDVGDLRRSRPCNPPERIKIGTVGPPRPGVELEAGRGRRGPGPRRAGDDRLPQRAREDRRDDRRRGLAAHRRRRRDRRRRLPDDRRSQEGADHQLGRQEHVAGQHRGEAQGGQRR